MKEIGLFGFKVPTEYAGGGFTNLQYCNIIQSLSRNTSMFMILSYHNMVVKVSLFPQDSTLLSTCEKYFLLQALTIGGSESQKQKYLPQLASGQLISTFCFSDSIEEIDSTSLK